MPKLKSSAVTLAPKRKAPTGNTASADDRWDKAFAIVRAERDAQKLGPREQAQLLKDAELRRLKRDAEHARQELIDEETAWLENGRFDPDAWFVVPEFGKMPADAKFDGFNHPVRYREIPRISDHVRSLVRASRRIIQAELRGSTLAEVHRFAQSAPWVARDDWQKSLPQHQHAALVYVTIISELHRSTFTPPSRAMAHIAFAANLLVTWGVDGVAAAAMLAKERIRDGGSNGGRKGAALRRRQAKANPEKVEKEARKLGWPAIRRNIYKPLSRHFKCSAEHIGQILRARESTK